MSKSNQAYQDSQIENMENLERDALFAEKERDFLIENGYYSSDNLIAEKHDGYSTLKFYWNPEICEVVVWREIPVADGEDSMDYHVEIDHTIGTVNQLVLETK